MASLTKLPLVTRLSERVIRILGCNPGFMTLQGTNTYLVGTGPRRVLIDTGDGEQPQYLELLNTVLMNEKATIEHICLTHWHADHIGGTNAIQTLLEQQLRCKRAIVWKARRYIFESVSPMETSTVWMPLKQSMELDIEGATLVGMFTPGHTSDHCSFRLLEEDAVFSGDCVLGEGTTVFEDLSDYMKSLKMLLDLKPKVIYPGHGPMVENAIEHVQSYINHRESRDSDIIYLLDQLGRPLGEEEITNRIYKHIPEEVRPYAVSNVLQHLKKLEREGRVQGRPGDWYTRIFYD